MRARVVTDIGVVRLAQYVPIAILTSRHITSTTSDVLSINGAFSFHRVLYRSNTLSFGGRVSFGILVVATLIPSVDVVGDVNEHGGNH